MAHKLFIDTWGWLTLRDKREAQHQIATQFYRKFESGGGNIYTTDYILDETVTLLFKRLAVTKALGATNNLLAAVQVGKLHLEWITPGRFTNAHRLRQKFLDKPDISFTDLTSMVVMQELDIQAIMAGDEHFMHVGMGFQRVP